VNSLHFLKEVLDFVEKTPELTGKNCVENKTTYPNPFFGNIESAQILTVGVNPSDGESAPSRESNWPADMTRDQPHERLKNYFVSRCPHHCWFDGWIESFRKLKPGFSYTDGSVAHKDLSPRVTIPMSRVRDKLIFQKMIGADIEFLFKILFESENIRLVMTGGKVLGDKYVAQWIRNCAPSPLILRPAGKGIGATSLYQFSGLNREVWLFSCGVSPRFREQLLKNVSENRGALIEFLS